MRERMNRLLEVQRRLAMRGSRHRLLSGPAAVDGGLGPYVTMHGVVGELFHVVRSRIRQRCPGIMFGVATHCQCFERVEDPSVQFVPMFFQKVPRPVGCEQKDGRTGDAVHHPVQRHLPRECSRAM